MRIGRLGTTIATLSGIAVLAFGVMLAIESVAGPPTDPTGWSEQRTVPEPPGTGTLPISTSPDRPETPGEGDGLAPAIATLESIPDGPRRRQLDSWEPPPGQAPPMIAPYLERFRSVASVPLGQPAETGSVAKAQTGLLRDAGSSAMNVDHQSPASLFARAVAGANWIAVGDLLDSAVRSFVLDDLMAVRDRLGRVTYILVLTERTSPAYAEYLIGDGGRVALLSMWVEDGTVVDTELRLVDVSQMEETPPIQ